MPVSLYIRGLRERIGHELVLVPGVAAVVRNAYGEILVLRKSEDGQWSLPAGAIDPGESPREALTREVYEETGLVVTSTRLLDVFGGEEFRSVYPNGDRVEFTVCVFACEVSGELRAVDGEAAEFDWCAPERVARRLDLPYPAELFEPMS